jgi:hypothetical protein
MDHQDLSGSAGSSGLSGSSGSTETSGSAGSSGVNGTSWVKWKCRYSGNIVVVMEIEWVDTVVKEGIGGNRGMD